MRKKELLVKRIALASVVAACLVFPAAQMEAAPSIAAYADGERQVNTGAILADRTYEKKSKNDGIISLVLYGMGTPTDSGPSGDQAQNVSLINRGVIEVHMREIAEKGYDRIMGRGLTAEQGAALVNDGSIRMFMDQGKEYGKEDGKEIFVHGMIAGDNSYMINNGSIEVSGAGSDGANVRGMSSDSDGITIVNNGAIALRVKDSYMVRALTTVGKKVLLTNAGTVWAASDSVVFGLAQGGGSTVINSGLVEVRSEGARPGKMYGSLPNMTPLAYGMAAYGWLNADTVLRNTGILRAEQAANEKGYRAYAMAVSLKEDDQSNPLPKLSLEVSSTGITEAVNGYELGVNIMPDFYHSGASVTGALEVKPLLWATTLRDFSHNLFAAGDNATLNFAGATMILRPPAGYRQGTAYSVAPDALVDKIYAGNAEIANFDQLQFVSEMPDFLRLDRTVDPDQASIALSGNRAAAEHLLSAAALGSVDFARQGLAQLDEALQNAQRAPGGSGWDTFFTPYYGRVYRDRGLDLKLRGFVGGAQRQADEATSIGWHFGYSWGDGSGGAYGAASDLRAAVAGLQAKRSLADGTYLRGQLSGYFGGGDTAYNFISPYGTQLGGRSDNEAKGVYGAVFYGREQRFAAAGRRTAELGLSGLSLRLDPDVHWRLLQQKLPGYDMEVDDTYRALFAHAAARWETERPMRGGTARAFLGLGLRAKLTGDDIGMRMIGASVPGTVAEDDVALTATVGYAWNQEDAWTTSLSYTSAFGSAVKAHALQASLTRRF